MTAIIIFALAVAALGTMVAAYAGEFASVLPLIAVPVTIVALVGSIVLAAFAFLFKKDVLCKIAFSVDLAALLLSLISAIIWLAT